MADAQLRTGAASSYRWAHRPEKPGMTDRRSQLYYHGTQEEVRAGDIVLYRTFLLRRKKRGVAAYIPEKAADELAAEGKDSDDWLIDMQDGTVMGWLYHPAGLQPSKRLSLIARQRDFTRKDSSYRAAIEAAEQSEMTGNEFLGCLAIAAIVGLVASAIVAYLWSR